MSMKDALKSAGLNSTKTENMRDSAKGRDRKQSEKNQYTRNFCEVCELSMPDVERFKHKNPTVDAEWICLGCADKNNILDDFRVTNQSDFAKQNKYHREFGPTKAASEFGTPTPRKNTHQRKQNNNQDRNKRYGKSRNNQNRPNRNNDNRTGGYRSNHNPNPRRRRGNVTQPSAPFTIDENGEKNFNC